MDAVHSRPATQPSHSAYASAGPATGPQAAVAQWTLESCPPETRAVIQKIISIMKQYQSDHNPDTVRKTTLDTRELTLLNPIISEIETNPTLIMVRDFLLIASSKDLKESPSETHVEPRRMTHLDNPRSPTPPLYILRGACLCFAVFCLFRFFK